MTRVALYRHLDAEGALLWVGVARNPIKRMAEHGCRSHWFGSIASITIEWHPDQKSAEAAETKAILEEKPRFNVQVSRSAPRGRYGKRRHDQTLLARWLKDNGVTQVSIADAVGVSYTHLSHVARGRDVPSYGLAVKIERATNGAVPASSWAAPTAIAAE